MSLSISDDPFEVLHTDVFDLIFQHLPGESMNVSTVSPLWYKSIGSLNSCMQKVKLVFGNNKHDNDNSSEILKIQNNSIALKRCYQHISFDFMLHSQSVFHKIIKSREACWKNVELFNGSIDELLLNDFCQSVQYLKLNRINYKENRDRIESVSGKEFPNLECLEIFSCNDELLNLFKKCSTLRELSISSNREVKPNKDILGQLLLNNSKLTKLKVFGDFFLSRELIFSCKIQLHTLVVAIDFNETEYEALVSSFQDFLQSQSNFLRVIDIASWMGVEVLKICLKMPFLKDFSYNFNHKKIIDWNDIELHKSQSIRRFCIDDICANEPAIFYNVMLQKIPNLTIYKAKYIQLNCLIELEKIQFLEELYIEVFNVSLLPFTDNSFLNLRILKSWHINENLIKYLKVKQIKNHFESLILQNV